MASEKILAMIEEVKGLSVLELNELVKALEEELLRQKEEYENKHYSSPAAYRLSR